MMYLFLIFSFVCHLLIAHIYAPFPNLNFDNGWGWCWDRLMKLWETQGGKVCVGGVGGDF